MPSQSPKGGKYVLTGVSFRRAKEGGGWTKFSQGDVVTLNDEEAARLCSGRYSSFKPASEVSDEEREALSGPSSNFDNTSTQAKPVTANK